MELVVENLCVARGGVPVLEGVSFALGPGDALVLRGPNGAGKTTLLRTIAGLQPAVEGHIRMPQDSVAYAGHADGLKATLTVVENLEFWAAIFGSATIGSALDAFELSDLADRPAQGLSAGQRRRLGLSRMLVTGRPIWILDEPTVSLDARSVAMFADMVRAHLHDGGMALMATHIDLGIEAEILDVSPFKARLESATGAFDEAFL